MKPDKAIDGIKAYTNGQFSRLTPRKRFDAWCGYFIGPGDWSGEILEVMKVCGLEVRNEARRTER